MKPTVWTSSAELDAHLLKMPLAESREPFAPIPPIKGLSFVSGEHTWALRQSVVQALTQAAADFASQGFTLQLEDAYRSLTKQQEKFITHLAEVTTEDPQLEPIEAKKHANVFIAGIPILAAHTAGAAVDVTLLDAAGNQVDMGCPYLELSDLAITNVEGLSPTVQKNRQLLVSLLGKYGFVNYPFEYWHFSIGDVCAAYLSGSNHGIYGPVDFDINTRHLTFPLKDEQLYTFF